MHKLGIRVDSFAALFALKACSSVSHFSMVPSIHAHVLKIGLWSHVYVGTALMSVYIVSSFDDARKMFDEMPERNVVTWNAMITGYSKLGDVKSARSVFDSMPMRDVASWSAMINGYLGARNWNQGLALFREIMMKGELKPDIMMMVTLLSGCSHIHSVPLLGKSIHAYVLKNDLGLDVVVRTLLVDMYAKCGLLKYADRVFKRMHEKNVMAWSAMICGLALHGHGNEALEVFEKMKLAGVKPNEKTFTGILSACCHAGLVDEGRKNFRGMTEEYGIEPRIQHYGCMVDLFGKAGLLEEAYEVINTMKLEPNVIIWTSFLIACKVHRQLEMAQRVTERALRAANPDNGGGLYTLISDLYALGGKWDEVEHIRKMMIDRNVKKTRGSSFIEVDLNKLSSDLSQLGASIFLPQVPKSYSSRKKRQDSSASWVLDITKAFR